MPSEPEQRIEARLRDYAARRQAKAGGPWGLHPATRRLLQHEVARVWGRHPPGPSRAWWQGLRLLWPRLVFATALLAVMGFVFWQLQPPPESPREMAQAKPESEAPLAPVSGRVQADKLLADRSPVGETKTTPPASFHSQPTRLPPAAGAVIEPDSSTALSAASVVTDALITKPNQPAPAPTARPSERTAPRAENGVFTRADAGSPTVVTTAPAPAIAPPSEARAGTAGGQPGFSLASPAKEEAVPRSSPEQLHLALQNKDDDRQPSFGGHIEAVRAGNQPTGLVAALAKAEAQPPVATQWGVTSLADSEHRLGEAVKTAGVPERYSFRQVVPLKPARAARAARGVVGEEAVLDVFNVELAGDQVRIIDADGSVYTGRLAEPTAGEPVKAKASARSERLRLTAESGTNTWRFATLQESSNLWFTVRGTNHSLKQLVTVDGALVGGAGSPAITELPLAQSRSSDTRRIVAGPRSEGVSSGAGTGDFVRFRGKATIGEAREITVDALRVKP